MNFDVNNIIKTQMFLKYGFLLIVAIFLICGTLVKVSNDTKETNCITYYTSLGYTANGCEKYVERFIAGNE